MRVSSVKSGIQKLKDEGFWIDVHHDRVYEQGSAMPWPRGGWTTVVIKAHKDGPIMAQGESKCALEDSFNKRKGVAIALGRALAVLNRRD